MKRLSVFAAALLAALVLYGCGASEPIASSGEVQVPEVSQPGADASTVKPSAPAPSASVPVNPAPKPTVEVSLTKEQAQAIALQHAGFTVEQVTGLKSELDVDKGVAHYEVEFRVGQWEYDYDIHADTGAVLSFEKDD